MFCPKCGNQLAEGAKFCDMCGESIDSSQPEIQAPAQTPDVRPPEIYADHPQQTVPEPQKPKKKGLLFKIAAIVLAVLILLSGVTVLGYFTFLPAKYTLLAAEYMTVQNSYRQLNTSLDRQEKLMNSVYDKSIKSQTDLSFSIDPAVLADLGVDSQTADIVKQYLSNISLKLTGETDMSANKENLSFGVNYQNNPVVTLNGFIDGKKLGFNIPELSQTSLVGEFKDLPKLSEFYPDTIDSSFTSSLENTDPWIAKQIHDKIQINHSDIKKLMQTYTMAFVNGLNSSDMTIQRGQTTDVLGEETSCQEVTITLNQDSQKALITSLLNTVKNDDNLYNLVFGNILKVYDIISESNPEMVNGLQSMGADLNTVLKKPTVRLAISQLNKMITPDMLPKDITIKAYIKGFNVVKHEISIPLSDYGDKLVLTFENVVNGNNVNRQVTINASSAGETFTGKFNVQKNYDQASDTQDVMVSLNADMSGTTNGNVSFKLDSDENPAGSGKVDQKANIAFSYNLDDSTTVQKGDASVSYTGTKTRNKDGLTTGIDSKADVTINIPEASPKPITFSIGIKNETTYGGKVTTPDWASANTIDLSTATKEDIDAYLSELQNSLGILGSMLGQ